MLLISNIALAASIPRYITVQGKLTDASDLPVASGSYLFNFTVYNSSIAGSGKLIWTEQFFVTVTNGLFNTVLSPPPSPPGLAYFDVPYFLEVKVGTNPSNLNILQPRINITSAGYAFVSAGISGNLDMKTNNITNIGYVGIGTSTPTQTLDVNGNINATGASGNGAISTVRYYGPDSGSCPSGGSGCYLMPNGASWLDTLFVSQTLTVGGNAVLTNISGGIISYNILDNSITASDIGPDAVGTSEIASGAVTNPKIANNAVNYTQINSAQIQRRLQNCSDGSSIKQITDSGTVLCEPDDTGITTSGWSMSGANVYNDTTGVKVGIGTNNPVQKLDVVGNINTTGNMYFSTASSAISVPFDFKIWDKDYSKNRLWWTWASGLGDYVNLTATGSNQVNSTLTLSADSGLLYNYNGKEQLRISTDGKVGIGTSTPKQALNVIGDANVTGVISTVRYYGPDSGSCPSGGSGCYLMPNGASYLDTLFVSQTLTVGGNAVLTNISGGIISYNILDGSIATADLANNAVTSGKILDSTIVSADLANGAVANANIQNSAINYTQINSAQIQRRLQNCSDGSSIKQITDSGTVLCEPDDVGSASGWIISGVNLYNNTSSAMVGIGTDTPLEKLTVGTGDIGITQGQLNTPLGGFGRYQNEVIYSEQVNNNDTLNGNKIWDAYCDWGTMTNNTNETTAPDGTYTAEKLVTSGSAGCGPGLAIAGRVQIIPTYNSTNYSLSIWLKGKNGGEVTILGINDNYYCSHILTKEWKRYNCTIIIPANPPGGNTQRGFQFWSTAVGITYYVWGAQREENQTDVGLYLQTVQNNTNNSGYGLVVNSIGPHIFSNGSIGIGTVNPQKTLEVANHSTPGIRISKSDPAIGTGENIGAIEFWGDGGRKNVTSKISVDSPSIWGAASSPSYMSFYTTTVGSTTPAERMRINYDGRVGIGTNDPLQVLDVRGNIHIGGTANAPKYLRFATYSTTEESTARNYIGVESDGFNIVADDSPAYANISFKSFTGSAITTKMKIDAATGNIGIGTTTPTGLLDVNGRAGATSLKVSSTFGDLVNNAPWYGIGTSSFSIWAGQPTFYATQLAGFYGLNFQTANGQMVIRGDNGNVGIGQPSPTANLEIRGTTSANNMIQKWGLGGGSLGYTTLELYKTADQNGNFTFMPYCAGGCSASSGKIGFGGWNAIPWNGVQMMLDTATGNVGIGTTAPARKLDVNGEMHVGGYTYFKEGDVIIQSRDSVANREAQMYNDAGILHVRSDLNADGDKAGTITLEAASVNRIGPAGTTYTYGVPSCREYSTSSSGGGTTYVVVDVSPCRGHNCMLTLTGDAYIESLNDIGVETAYATLFQDTGTLRNRWGVRAFDSSLYFYAGKNGDGVQEEMMHTHWQGSSQECILYDDVAGYDATNTKAVLKSDSDAGTSSNTCVLSVCVAGGTLP